MSNFSTRLKRAVEREREAVLRRDWTEARLANEEAREAQEAIREALMPSTVRAREEVRHDLPNPNARKLEAKPKCTPPRNKGSLPDAAVRRIRRARLPHFKIAKEIGISVSMVDRIRSGKAYRWVT